MGVTDYIKDRIVWILLNLAGLILMLLYLVAVGNHMSTVLVIFILVFFSYLLYFITDYRGRNRYFKALFQQMDQMDQPYLIAECMEDSWRTEDRIYRDVIRRSNKAVIDRIHALEREQKEYREFIEGWIHEVKRPMTGIALVSETLPRPAKKKLMTYGNALEHQVNQALFYARSDSVYKDYIIRELPLAPLIGELIKKNKYLLQDEGMHPEVDCGEINVYSDALWLDFILEQILLNAVKYRDRQRAEGSEVTFCAKSFSGGVALTVRDNGIGIRQSELSRIFEKGFTGSNGRKGENSTGIGLYLCRKLCGKLGLTLTAASEEGVYTELTVLFPIHAFLRTLK